MSDKIPYWKGLHNLCLKYSGLHTTVTSNGLSNWPNWDGEWKGESKGTCIEKLLSSWMALLCSMNYHILEAPHAYYIQLNRETVLFHTTEQGGRLIIYSKRWSYYIKLNRFS